MIQINFDEVHLFCFFITKIFVVGIFFFFFNALEVPRPGIESKLQL